MDIGRMHEMLAEISHSFSVDVLARDDTSAKIAEALGRHGKLAQRHSPLRPTFVAWLVLAMTLFREKSIPNVLAQLIAAARGKRPAIPLKPVTDSAISQARARMGPEPMRTLFRSLAEEVHPEPSFHGLRVSSAEVGAKELALLYHERWESEVSYDEVKVHLQTVKHGGQHTEFRSKSPGLVEQEFWAMLATYNLVRELMLDAARAHDIPPRELSFVDSLVVIGLTLPEVQSAPDRRLPFLRRRLLADIAECRLDRPRRPRVYDRVVKVKMSNYALKRPHHRQRFRDIAKALNLVEAGVEQLR